MHRASWIVLAISVLLHGGFVHASSTPILRSDQLQKGVPALPLRLWQNLRKSEELLADEGRVVEDDVASLGDQVVFAHRDLRTEYKAHFFDQKVSHDSAVPAFPSNATFKQRYWFDATYYEEGGPIFFLDGGETDGEDRLPFLKSGILRILSEATGGIGVVFEHRYYGESFPVANLTTDSFRYLTTLQSLHDSSYFAENIIFPGLEKYNLTSKKAAWIYYGGSYAGGKSAFARKLFPHVWWGAIASSAVTKAIVDFWEYYEPVRKTGPKECISALQNNTAIIDGLLNQNQPLITSALKNFFGLPNITLNTDFVNALHIPLGAWQARNWDPQVGSNAFFDFCNSITTIPEEVGPAPDQYSTVSFLQEAVETVVLHPYSILPGWPSNPRKSFALLSAYAVYTKENISTMCPDDLSQDECFGTDVYVGDGLVDAPWKSWAYQFCTEWGYGIGAAPEGRESLISRLITPEYTFQICQKAFPPGKLNKVPKTPNVTEINQWGGFELEYPRLAFIDGSEDPWLYATPHSPNAKNPDREDTKGNPFKLIPGGVHHWDENGLLEGHVPKPIQNIHVAEVRFVKAWLRQWKRKGHWKIGDPDD